MKTVLIITVSWICCAGAFAATVYFETQPVAKSQTVVVDYSVASNTTDCAWIITTNGSVCE